MVRIPPRLVVERAGSEDPMKRLLFIAHRVPYPPNKGERVRAFHEIQSLGRHFRLTLASLSHTPSDVANAEPLRRACEKVIIAPARRKIGLSGAVLALLERKSATEVFFRSRPMRKLLAEEVEREPFDLVFAYSSSTLALALEVPARARVMDLVDVDSAKWTHYADHSSWPKSWAFRREARGVRVLEQRALKECDAVLVVSEAEARALPALEDKP